MATVRVDVLDDGNRAIRFAFLISLALHAALLWILPTLRSSDYHRGNTAAPIAVRLVEPLPRPVADQVLLTVPAYPTPPAAARPASKTPVRSTHAIDLPVVPRVVLKTSPATAMTEPAQAADAGTVAQYRISVLSAARRFKHYPDIAIQNNWQGRVDVRMVIDSSGEISGLDVRTSAGHAVLDRHALEMIERAKAIAPIPPALRGREFRVDVPVVFSLPRSGA